MARRNKHKKELKEAKTEIRQLTAEGGWVVDKNEHVQCVVCGKIIKPGKVYRRLPPDEKVPEWRQYHVPECAPGTELWRAFHPSYLSKLMMEQKEVKAEKRLTRRRKKLLKEGKPIKTEKGKGLEPMKPVEVPKEVLKEQPKKIQELINKLSSLKERSSKEGSILRKQLRKLGFRLSNFRK